MEHTVKALYSAHTGDNQAHQRTIAARLAKLDPRRQAIVRARAAGAPLSQIAAQYGITRASVSSAIDKALRAIQKDIAGMPRYHVTGHPGRQKAKSAAKRKEPGKV